MRCVLAWAIFLGGCSYAFTYGGATPERLARNVRVDPLLDETAEGWPAAVVTDRLRVRFGPHDDHRPLQVLEGEVLRIEGGNIPVARPDGTAAGLSVVVVRGRARLKAPNGVVLLDVGERAGSAELVVGTSVSEIEDGRRLAVERAAQALADQLADAVMTP
jgi:hypothetical protein